MVVITTGWSEDKPAYDIDKKQERHENRGMRSEDKPAHDIDKNSIEYHKAYVLKSIPKTQSRYQPLTDEDQEEEEEEEEHEQSKDLSSHEILKFGKEQHKLMSSLNKEQFKEYSDTKLRETVLNILDTFEKTMKNAESMSKSHRDILKAALSRLNINGNFRNFQTIKNKIYGDELNKGYKSDSEVDVPIEKKTHERKQQIKRLNNHQQQF